MAGHMNKRMGGRSEIMHGRHADDGMPVDLVLMAVAE
jgi:hypothetical protein